MKTKKEAPCYPHTLIYLASVAEILSQRQMDTSTFLTKVPLTKPGTILSKFSLENQWVYQAYFQSNGYGLQAGKPAWP